MKLKFYLVRNSAISENYTHITEVMTMTDILFDSSSIEKVKQALCNEVDRELDRQTLRDELYADSETKVITRRDNYAVVLITYDDDKTIRTTMQTYYITPKWV